MEIYRGDTFEFDFSSTLTDGAVYVFKPGDILKIGVKEKLNHSRYLLYKKIDITKETDRLTITFTPEETKKCSIGKKILEVELTDNEERVRTLIQEELIIKEDLINE